MAATVTTIVRVVLANVMVVVLLLVPVELIFGTWVRAVSLRDLRRFSIPVDVSYTVDASHLYDAEGNTAVRYTRDRYGLRGQFASLADVEVLTMGGSTTDQRYLDDARTWQAVTAREYERMTGRPTRIANAGVDGQSTTGMLFDFASWLPLLPELKPKSIVFYAGINDVLARADRADYDRSVDVTSWRFRSAIYQLVRTARSNLRARSVRAAHGRMPADTLSRFTERGLLDGTAREDVAREVTGGFLRNVARLREQAEALGATPIFMTQTAFGWNAGNGPARGVAEELQVLGRTINYADVAFIHQHLNRGLIEYCRATNVRCLDLANEVTFEMQDFYDYLHNTPRGAEKIGRYLASQLACHERTCQPMAP